MLHGPVVAHGITHAQENFPAFVITTVYVWTPGVTITFTPASGEVMLWFVLSVLSTTIFIGWPTLASKFVTVKTSCFSPSGPFLPSGMTVVLMVTAGALGAASAAAVAGDCFRTGVEAALEADSTCWLLLTRATTDIISAAKIATPAAIWSASLPFALTSRSNLAWSRISLDGSGRCPVCMFTSPALCCCPCGFLHTNRLLTGGPRSAPAERKGIRPWAAGHNLWA